MPHPQHSDTINPLGGIPRNEGESGECYHKRVARKILEKLPIDVDDDPISPDELAEIEAGAAQIARGEYVTLDELRRRKV